MKAREKGIRLVPLIIWCSLIFYLSSQNAISVTNEKSADIVAHKLAHVFEYAVLYLTYYLAFIDTAEPHHKHRVMKQGIVFVVLYGISDELHQFLNPTRSPRVYDVVVDTIGGCIGYILIKYSRLVPWK